MELFKFGQIITVFDKPEYLFRPFQIVRRVLRSGLNPADSLQTLEMPWGLSLSVNVRETVGRALWHLGIYDLAMSEVIWRLVDAGEGAADVGANFGYVTSLMAVRVGPNGVVHAFEPHPDVFHRLGQNADLWSSSRKTLGKVILHPVAAGEQAMGGTLCIPKDFQRNEGLAYISENRSIVEHKSELKTFPVNVEPLDSIIENNRRNWVFKIDTEGTELSVLKGAQKMLTSGKVRDIVFEDHGEYPSPPMKYLEDLGYRLFWIQKNWYGPKLIEIKNRRKKIKWEPQNLLATLDSERALKRINEIKGWQSLSG